MKVLQIYKDFQPLGGGGVARYMHGLSTILATDLGCEVRLAILPSGGVHPLPDAPYKTAAVPWNELGEAVAWADIVHLHGARNPYAYMAARQAWKRDKPYVFTPHCYYDHGNMAYRAAKYIWDRTLESKLVARARAFILLDQQWVDDAANRSLSVARAIVMPTPVLWRELSVNAQQSIDLAGIPAILSISRLDAVKRLDDVIAALAMVPALSAAHFHIVGKGPDEHRLRAAAERFGVSARVRFYGFQPDSIAMRMLKSASVFVLPSEREGMPATLIEAMLVGRPVVASAIPGNAAVLRPLGLEQNLVPLGDAIALGETLARVAAAGSVSSEIQQRIHGRHTWEKAAPLTASIYADILAGRRPKLPSLLNEPDGLS